MKLGSYKNDTVYCFVMKDNWWYENMRLVKDKK